MAAEGVEGGATVHIEAPPEKVYGMISDVTRMGEWSPETHRCEWIDGAAGPPAGGALQGAEQAGAPAMVHEADGHGRRRRQRVHLRGRSTRKGGHALELQAHAEGRRDRSDRVLRVAPVHLVLQDRLAAEASEGTAPTWDREDARAHQAGGRRLGVSR